MEKTEEIIWYAMRATYRRELAAQRLLAQSAIESFVPMQYQITAHGRNKKRELVPAIHNLLFVHGTPSTIQQAKSKIPYLHYITRPEGGRNIPIVVPDEDMQRFIAITETSNDQLIYLNPEELDLSKGTRVRINSGNLAGQEGVFIKVRGARDKRVVVQIQGLVAVATATINPDFIEVIPPPQQLEI